MPYVTIAGRNVHHVVGRKTQTVNICTSRNQKGVYEARYSLPISVEMDAAELAAKADLEVLQEWLIALGGQPLSTDGRPGEGLPALLAADPEDPWLAGAKTAVEQVLDHVVDAFLREPYLHRVEHSLHAWIWSLLKQQSVLRGDVTLKDGRTTTQLVHKEWPETIPRKKKDGTDRPRGLFDLAVLSPEQLRKASVEQFVFGRIEAPIVIEVGLDYGLPHLTGDAHKLTWSKVRVPYLLHLSRLVDKDREGTEALLCDSSKGVLSAYVHLQPGTEARRSKRVHDVGVVHTDGVSPSDALGES